MDGATATIHNDAAPPSAPLMSHGLRMPQADVVRSLSQPKSGLPTSAKSAPIASTSECQYSDFAGASSRARRASVTMIGVSSASQVWPGRAGGAAEVRAAQAARRFFSSN